MLLFNPEHWSTGSHQLVCVQLNSADSVQKHFFVFVFILFYLYANVGSIRLSFNVFYIIISLFSLYSRIISIGTRANFFSFSCSRLRNLNIDPTNGKTSSALMHISRHFKEQIAPQALSVLASI